MAVELQLCIYGHERLAGAASGYGLEGGVSDALPCCD
jgi:hypothetical protein